MSAQFSKEQMQKKLVFGLGQTGLSCVRFLVREGYEVVVFDTRENPPLLKTLYQEFPNIDVKLQILDETIFDEIDQIILSPGVSLKSKELTVAIEKEIDIVGDIELFALNINAPVIAITGSNGKTTTTTLVGEILKAAGLSVSIGGNIGTPVLELLDAATPDYYLLELSSFQLETTKQLKPFIAVILNISADHMDRYDNLNDYAFTKLSLLNNATHKLINVDDKWLHNQIPTLGEVIGFAEHPSSENKYSLKLLDGDLWIVAGSRKICNTANSKLQGKHQLMNAIVSIAIADLCKVDEKIACQVLNEFDGLAHRTQFVATIDKVNYINDSKATNVGATLAAINGFDSSLILLAGGDGKGAEFSELAPAVENKVRIAILFGQDASLIEKAIGQSTQIVRAVSLEAAVVQAKELAMKDEIVLLSPACASFDMFDNYQHRGEVFIALVKELAQYG